MYVGMYVGKKEIVTAVKKDVSNGMWQCKLLDGLKGRGVRESV